MSPERFPKPDKRVARSTLIGAGVGVILLLGGILASALGATNSAWFVIGLAAVGIGVVLLVAMFFYEVGRSEDRDRTRHPSG